MDDDPQNKDISLKEKETSFLSNSTAERERKTNDESCLRGNDEALAISTEVVSVLGNSTVTIENTPSVGNLANGTKFGLAESPRSKRHFRRIKLSRKETRTRSRGSTPTRSSTASSSSQAFGSDAVATSASSGHVVLSQNSLHRHDVERDNDLLKLLDSPSLISSPSSAFVPSSITASQVISWPGFLSDADNSNKPHEQISRSSDRTFASSAATANTSISSATSSNMIQGIDEKAPSVELMSFSFTSTKENNQTEMLNNLQSRIDNVTISSLNASESMRSSSSDSTSDILSINDQTINSGIVSLATGGTQANQLRDSVESITSTHGVKGVPDYSSHADMFDIQHGRNQDSSTVQSYHSSTGKQSFPASVISGLSSVMPNKTDLHVDARSTTSTDSKIWGVTHFGEIGYSWTSLDDVSNRVSMTDVVDTLKTVDSQESRGTYSYSSSTLSEGDDSSFASKEVSHPTPSQNHQSMPVANLQEPTMVNSTEKQFTVSKDAVRSSVDILSPLNEVSVGTIEMPLKFVVPLNMEALSVRAKPPFTADYKKSSHTMPTTPYLRPLPPELLRKRSEGSSMSEEGLPDVTRKDSNPAIVRVKQVSISEKSSLPQQCTGTTSFNSGETDHTPEKNIPFYQRLAGDVTLSITGNQGKSEECLTRTVILSHSDMSITSTHDDVSHSGPLNSFATASNSEHKGHDTCSIGAECGSEEAESSSITATRHGAQSQSTLSPSNVVVESVPIVIESQNDTESSMSNVSTINNTGVNSTAHISSSKILEDAYNSTSTNVFIPHVNSRESISVTLIESSSNEKSEGTMGIEKKNSTTEDNMYIIEGLGYFKDNLEEMSEFEEELEKRREALFDYVDGGVDATLLQTKNHAIKMPDSVEFETDQEPSTGYFHWEGNFVGHYDDSWWSNEDTRAVKPIADEPPRAAENVDPGPKVDHRLNIEMAQSDATLPIIDNEYFAPDQPSSYYNSLLLPTFYVMLGICAAVVGCSVWCKRILITKKPSLPNLRNLFQQKQRNTEAIV